MKSAMSERIRDRMQSFRGTCLTLALPFCLTLTLTLAVFSIYQESYPIRVMAALFIMCLIPFVICCFTEKHRLFGGCVVILYLFICMSTAGSGMQMGFRSGGVSFMEWMLTIGDEVGAEAGSYYLASLVLLLPAFFGMTVYYFTKVRYRIFFLTLVSLIPCVIYIKVIAEIDNYYLVLIAFLNVGIFMAHRHRKRGPVRTEGRVSAVAASAVYVFILLGIAALIPKQSDAKYYSQFENLFLGGDTRTALAPDFSSISDYSGNADCFRSLSNRRMYTLYGNGISYMKRQTFDYYDFARDRWYADEYYSRESQDMKEWCLDQEARRLSTLQEALRAAGELSPEFAERYGLERLLEAEMIGDPLRILHVQSQNFGAMYYLAPARSFRMDPRDEAPFFVTAGGAFQRAEGPHSDNFGYDIYFYDEFAARNTWFSLGGSDFDSETSEQMLTEALELLQAEISDEDDVGHGYLLTLEAYLRLQRTAKEYREACAENTGDISPELRELAGQITGELTYDWEKAEAIRRYFDDEDFTYDLEFAARDTSPEYFLFDSRTGTCSDFASAYVLLARAAGLSVRYAEGYIPESAGRAGYYYINDRDSHAYPEVFIQNMGWTVYEPTVASDSSLFWEDERDFWPDLLGSLKVDYRLISVILRLAVEIAAVLLVVFLVLPLLQEIYFWMRIRWAAPERSVIYVYGRIAKRAGKKRIPEAASLTPHELAGRLEQMGCDISDLAFLAEEALYGGAKLEESHRRTAVEEYKKVRKFHL